MQTSGNMHIQTALDFHRPVAKSKDGVPTSMESQATLHSGSSSRPAHFFPGRFPGGSCRGHVLYAKILKYMFEWFFGFNTQASSTSLHTQQSPQSQAKLKSRLLQIKVSVFE